jgi:hypothetical protein
VHKAQALKFGRFNTATDPLVRFDQDSGSPQAQYLRCYLHDLGARSVIIEPNYFDRDYLSEFAAFYATSSAGYPNTCERVHYFSSTVDRGGFRAAVGGNTTAIAQLQEAYLGHIIVRPIAGAPLGRTVLRSYPDEKGIAAGTPRIMSPARWYEAHIAGVTLRVQGLAWQQQDSAVGSCATVALWSMLHSSAFDDHHAIPTTADITSTAHYLAPVGGREFPADAGLHLDQMLEVIKGHGLAPVLITGDVDGKFSPVRFSTLVASFVRSGYPVLVHGELDDGERAGHAVCIVGFRSPDLAAVPNGEALLDDATISHVYVHDDNLGPNVRFRIDEVPEIAEGAGTTVDLRAEAPEPRSGKWPTTNPTTAYGTITPTELVVAVHQELRTEPLALQRAAIKWSQWLPSILAHEIGQQKRHGATGMLVGSRFLRLSDYVEGELKSALRQRQPQVLARARLELWEKVAPMSLHIGLVRVSLRTMPVMDVLFDTSDSNRHLRPTACVAYHEQVPWLLERWIDLIGDEIDLGRLVRAW